MAVYKRGGKWVADIAIGGRGGTRKRKTLPSKKLAIAFEQDVRVKDLKGELGVEDRPDISFAEFIKKYRALCSVTKTTSTQERDEFTFRHLEPCRMASVLSQGAVVVERWTIETLMVGRFEDGALLGSQLAEDVLGPIG